MSSGDVVKQLKKAEYEAATRRVASMHAQGEMYDEEAKEARESLWWQTFHALLRTHAIPDAAHKSSIVHRFIPDTYNGPIPCGLLLDENKDAGILWDERAKLIAGVRNQGL